MQQADTNPVARVAATVPGLGINCFQKNGILQAE